MAEYGELRRLAGEAHREPWDYWDWASWEDAEDGFVRPAPNVERENAALIVAASPDVILALLDERERLREMLDRLLTHGFPIYVEKSLAADARALLDEPAEATR